MAKTINDPSRYPNGIIINNGTDIPLYVSGAFYVGAENNALVVDVDQFAQITNQGGLSGGHGILLDTAGYVTNIGHITGLFNGAIDALAGASVKNNRTITATGAGPGVYITGGIGNVYNYGQITASRVGVDLNVGGSISNSSAGTITSVGNSAVNISGSARLANAGLISTNSGSLSAVDLLNGGFIDNQAGGTISGASHGAIYISATAGAAGTIFNEAGGLLSGGGLISGYHGVDISGGPGSITNAGLIIGLTKPGAELLGGGVVTNAQSGTITTQGTGDAVYANNVAVTVLNAGVISAPKSSSNAVGLDSGGYVMNAATGTIVSAKRGIFAESLTTIVNAGMISTSGTSSEIVLQASGTIINAATGTLSGPTSTGIYLDGTGSFTGMILNAGSIIGGGGTNDGVRLLIASFVSNASSGLISGTAFGLHGSDAPDTVVNAGTIIATSSLTDSRPIGLSFGTAAIGSYLFNEAGGLITGGGQTGLLGLANAVYLAGADDTIVNAGTLLGNGRNSASVLLTAGGAINNLSTGIITTNQVLTSYGVQVSGAAGTINNLGTIQGHNQAIALGAGGVIKNQIGGTIAIALDGSLSAAAYTAINLTGTIAATVFNAGTIGSTDQTDAITAISSGSGLYLTNLATGVIGNPLQRGILGVGTITAAYGVISRSGNVSIANAGTIQSIGRAAVYISPTSSNTAYLGNAAGALVEGNVGVQIVGIQSTVVNGGTVDGASSVGVSLAVGSTLTNRPGGTITGPSDGVFFTDVASAPGSGGGTVTNSGTIVGGEGVQLANSGEVINQTGATISGTASFGVAIESATTAAPAGTIPELVNQAGAVITGIANPSAGAVVVAGIGTVFNAGTIGLAANSPIGYALGFLKPGYTYSPSTVNADYLSNAATGLIDATQRGIKFANYATVMNAGTISAQSGALYLDAGGMVSNTSHGTIVGGIDGVHTTTVVNAGALVSGGVALYGGGTVTNLASGQIAGVFISGGAGTIINAGTINGQSSRFSAISLAAGYANRVVIDTGSFIYGTINGGNAIGAATTSILEVATGRGDLDGIGTTITNFGSIQFDAGAAWTIAGNASGLAGQISGLTGADTIDIEGFIATGSNYLNGVLSLTSATSSPIALNLPGDFTTGNFLVAGDGTGTGTDVSLACFAAGTRIETPGGPLPVEALRVGDLVLAHDGDAGGALRPQPIVWIGHRSYDCAIHANPTMVWPVRVSAGALGAGLPRRDLFLSSQHALFLRGVLIPVGLLVNGRSIARVRVDRITYYHIELPAHAILLAEGSEAESYLNTDDRGTFDPLMPMAVRWPDHAALLWEAAGCARLVLGGPELNAARLSLVQPSRLPPMRRSGGGRAGG
jgi:hypothetical protein